MSGKDSAGKTVFAIGKFADMISVSMKDRSQLLNSLADVFAAGGFIHSPDHKMFLDSSVDFLSGPENLIIVIENNEDVTDEFIKEAMALHESRDHGKGNGDG